MARRRRKSHKIRNVLVTIIVVTLVASLAVGYQMYSSWRNELTIGKVLLVTSMGNMTIVLYENMPITSGNFKNLTEQGVYDGTIFHRVVHNFVIQGGDASLNGISVPAILDELPNKHSNVRGSVAMAKTSAPNSATSQFYINLKDNSLDLDSNYSVFGKVIAGIDVVDAIGNVSTDANDMPLQNVTLISAKLIT